MKINSNYQKSSIRQWLWKICLMFILCIGNSAMAQDAPATSLSNGAAVNANERKMYITRAEFAAMDDEQKRQVVVNFQWYSILDLINATESDLTVRNPDKFYIRASDIAALPPLRLLSILNDPVSFIVLSDTGKYPKYQMSRTEFQDLSEEKQQAIIDSGEFEIVQ